MKTFACVHPVDKTKVFVVEGEETFHYVSAEQKPDWDRLYAAQTNEQRTAALCGSMFGWQTPGAQAARS